MSCARVCPVCPGVPRVPGCALCAPLSRRDARSSTEPQGRSKWHALYIGIIINILNELLGAYKRPTSAKRSSYQQVQPMGASNRWCVLANVFLSSEKNARIDYIKQKQQTPPRPTKHFKEIIITNKKEPIACRSGFPVVVSLSLGTQPRVIT
jgi:hypothetical protein